MSPFSRDPIVTAAGVAAAGRSRRRATERRRQLNQVASDLSKLVNTLSKAAVSYERIQEVIDLESTQCISHSFGKSLGRRYGAEYR